MEQIYMTELYLEKVRHLKDIRIPISENGLRHLILTGENGSGKTSVLDALSHFINEIATSDRWMRMESALDASMRNEKRARQQKKSENEIYAIEKDVQYFKNVVESIRQGVRPQFNYPLDSFNAKYEKGEYIIAYYKAERAFYAEPPKHIEKVELQEHYSALEQPRNDFIKYLRDLSVTEALAFKRGNVEKSRKIKSWFEKFQELLRKIFHDETLRLEFDDDTFSITIYEAGKEPFDFNTLSSGYAAVLDIVADLIIRMEKQTNQTFDFYMPGIVLIDEIETHLHVELQKEIMRLLTTIFPNVQFIVSTHSPFILNSIENAVIYDLEKKILVKDGLADIPYEGIVEGYFSADKLSASLKEKFERYKELIHRNTVTDEELEEITRLEMYLDEIPDYLEQDFHNKCYICELKDLQDPQVEHLLPHKNGKYPDRKFDWNNLFWACGHCNRVKNQKKYEEGILDCCKKDPEQYIRFMLKEREVVVRAREQGDGESRLTAELVWEIFNVKNTGMRIRSSAQRVKALMAEMNLLYDNLEKVKKNPTGLVLRKLKTLLRRESAFAAFKRNYVREHIREYPALKEYLE